MFKNQFCQLEISKIKCREIGDRGLLGSEAKNQIWHNKFTLEIKIIKAEIHTK